MIRLLKLADDELNSEDMLSIHLGRYLTHGRVSYGTNISVVSDPKYVLFVLGNVEDICYLCHVADYAYDPDFFRTRPLRQIFTDFVPDCYKNEEHKTWFVFDSMQKIPIDFLEQLLSDRSDASVFQFIKTRANNKKL